MYKKVIISILLALTLLAGNFPTLALADSDIGLTYQGHVQSIGWQSWVAEGETIGTIGRNLRIEAFKFNLVNAPAGIRIKYRTHVQNIGWQDWVYDGSLSGTSGRSLRIEAIQIVLENAPSGYHVEYRGYVQNIGWQNWVRDGQVAGTSGRALRIEALQVRIVKDNADSNNTIEMIKLYSRIQNQYYGLENLGERLSQISNSLALSYESITYQNDIAYLNGVNDNLNEVINHYNDLLDGISNLINTASNYNIDITDMNTILDKCFNSIEYYKMSIQGLYNFYDVRNNDNFNKYLNNSKAGFNSSMETRELSYKRYYYFYDIIQRY